MSPERAPARLASAPARWRDDAAPTIPDLLRRVRARGRGGETGLRFLDRHEAESFLDWHTVIDRALDIGQRLVGLGVRPGERVGLLFPTGPEFFDGFFGALLAGAVPAPLYPPIRLARMAEYEERTAAMLEAAGVRAVLAGRAVRRLLGGVEQRYRPPLGLSVLADLAPHRAPLPRVASDSLALVQFSSGTTAAPKPVALTHRALLEQAHLLSHHWPDSAQLRHSGLSWLPLYHDMGLIGCVLPALLRPADLTLLGPELFVARPALWLRALSRYRATISPAPNFAYALCVERIDDAEIEGIDLSSWRVALNGAESVAPAVLRAFRDRFARYGLRAEAMTPVYGLAEAALAVTFSDLERPWQSRRVDRSALSLGVAQETRSAEELGAELVSLGRPVPGFELEIRDDRGHVVAERRLGKIWVRGPSLMREYLGQPDATRRVLRHGWLDTGDLGFVAGGELFLAGRAKDVLILNGRNHPPEPAEAAAGEVPGIRTGCVVAGSLLSPGGLGEELWLLAELRRGFRGDLEATAATVRRAVLARCGLRPDHVVLLDPGALPRTSSGKLRRREALRRLQEGELRASRGGSLWRELASRPLVLAAAALLRSQAAFRQRRAEPESDEEAQAS